MAIAEMRCPNCGEIGGRHFAPPSLGEPGFYTCHPTTSLGLPEGCDVDILASDGDASLPPAPPTLAPDACEVIRRRAAQQWIVQPQEIIALCDTVAALRAEVARQDALLRDVGSVALASWSPEYGTYNIRIPDATWKAVRAYIRAARSSAAGEQDLKIGGITVKTDPDIPPGEARIVDQRTGKVLAQIVGVPSRSAAGEDTDG